MIRLLNFSSGKETTKHSQKLIRDITAMASLQQQKRMNWSLITGWVIPSQIKEALFHIGVPSLLSEQILSVWRIALLSPFTQSCNGKALKPQLVNFPYINPKLLELSVIFPVHREGCDRSLNSKTLMCLHRSCGPWWSLRGSRKLDITLAHQLDRYLYPWSHPPRRFQRTDTCLPSTQFIQYHWVIQMITLLNVLRMTIGVD